MPLKGVGLDVEICQCDPWSSTMKFMFTSGESFVLLAKLIISLSIDLSNGI
jgi:hypothetical protein